MDIGHKILGAILSAQAEFERKTGRFPTDLYLGRVYWDKLLGLSQEFNISANFTESKQVCGMNLNIVSGEYLGLR